MLVLIKERYNMIITVKKKHWWDKLLDLIFDTKEIYNFQYGGLLNM